MAGDDARHGLAAGPFAADPDAHSIAYPKPLAAGLVRDLDRRRTNGEARRVLPRPRKVLERVAAELPRVDPLDRVSACGVGVLIDVEDEAPRGARLVVVVSRRHSHSHAVERYLVCMAVLDHPRQPPEALAPRRAPAGLAVDAAARADRDTVARLEVAPFDVPAHE